MLVGLESFDHVSISKVLRTLDQGTLGTARRLLRSIRERIRFAETGDDFINLDPWNKELELTCAWNFELKIGTPVGSIVKERCAKNGEKRRTRF